MKPSQEIARREITKFALRRLAAGGESGRRELFAGSPFKSKEADKVNWQLDILKRLEEHRYVQHREVSDKRARVYALAPGATLARFLSEERELTRLIWPADVQDDVPAEEASAPAEGQPSFEEETSPAEETNGVSHDAPAPSVEDMVATTLKLVGLVAQKVIVLAERIESIDARSAEALADAKSSLAILKTLL